MWQWAAMSWRFLVPGARSAEAWPAHLFVLSHVATMVLSLPWVYGSRLILAIFLFAPISVSAATVSLWGRLHRRASRSAPVTP